MPGEEGQSPGVMESALVNAIRENAIEIFLVAPTLPVTVFLRRSLGFRVLKPWVIYLAFIIFNTFLWFSLAKGAALGNQTELFILLAADVAFMALSIYWRYTAWGIIKRGELWHTRSRGVSYLGFLPFTESKIQRFVEPAVCFVLGVVLFKFFTIMAIWLMLSGMGLLVLEQIIYDIQLNAMLDQYDGIIDAKVAADNADYYSGKAKEKDTPSITESSGVSVFVAPELHEMIAKRKAERAAQKATQP